MATVEKALTKLLKDYGIIPHGRVDEPLKDIVLVSDGEISDASYDMNKEGAVMRLIDADALIEEILSWTMYDEVDKDSIVRTIEDQPTVDAVEVVHGQWIEGLDGSCMCSRCSRVIRYEIGYYCPNCGAKMEVKE